MTFLKRRNVERAWSIVCNYDPRDDVAKPGGLDSLLSKKVRPNVAHHVGRMGLFRQKGALWRMFLHNTRQADLQCMWNREPIRAANVIVGLGRLGVRKLLSGWRFQAFVGCANVGLREDRRRLTRVRRYFREVSGRSYSGI